MQYHTFNRSQTWSSDLQLQNTNHELPNYEEAKDEMVSPVTSNVVRVLYNRDQNESNKVKNEDEQLRVERPAGDPLNMTMGDLELREITLFDGKRETLWVQMEKRENELRTSLCKTQSQETKKPLQHIFISFKVKRISELNTEKVCLNWVTSETDYQSWYKAKQNDDLINWEPSFIPKLEFMNKIEVHEQEWESYPNEGCFRMQTFEDFNREKVDEIPFGEFDCMKSRFIRCKLECDVTLSEELELQSYPFDYQPLNCRIVEKSKNQNLRFFPSLRKANFASFDPSYTKLDEWNIEGMRLEIGTSNGGSSRSSEEFPTMIITMMVSRRWKSVLINTVSIMFLVCFLSFCAFSIPFEDTADRLAFSLTLLLTAVFFDTQPDPAPYLTFMDYYISTSYLYLALLMIENSLGAWFDCYVDEIGFKLLGVFFVAQNIGFTVYAICIRRTERKKLTMDADEEQASHDQKELMWLNYRNAARCGNNGRLLAFPSTGIEDLFVENIREYDKDNLKIKEDNGFFF